MHFSPGKHSIRVKLLPYTFLETFYTIQDQLE